MGYEQEQKKKLEMSQLQQKKINANDSFEEYDESFMIIEKTKDSDQVTPQIS